MRDARAAIAAIHARGGLPLLVGGTMLYLRALHHGLAPLPPASPELRGELDAAGAARRLAGAARGARARAIREAAARIAPQDAQRIQRALEVYRLTGVPISQLAARHARGGATSFAGCATRCCPQFARAELRARLAARFARMLRGGVAG